MEACTLLVLYSLFALDVHWQGPWEVVTGAHLTGRGCELPAIPCEVICFHTFSDHAQAKPKDEATLKIFLT